MPPRETGARAQFVAWDVDGELSVVLIADSAGLGDPRTKLCPPASLCEVAEMRMHVVGDRSAGMIHEPAEASRECPGGNPVQIVGCAVPVDAWACRRQDGRCFSFAAGKVGAVDAVNDGLLPVGHHDRVAQDIDRSESEEPQLDRIDDTDIRIEYAQVACTHGVTSRITWRCCVVNPQCIAVVP